MALATGSRIGPYEIKSLLGSGGMGEVYRARDTRLERDVALKVLPQNFVEDPERLRRFEQEARTAGSLNHPNVVAVYDVGKENGNAYLVSELLEGETLRARLEEGSLSSRKAIEYALQIAKGLSAAHQKGIVHRDLKPENLFITADGHVKILDFGLAKLAHPELDLSGDSNLMTQQRTADGVLLGTPGYMSPEQVRGRALDPRSDIFNFGAILYEMLSGKRAFAGDSVVERMNAILKEDPPELSTTHPQISPGLSRFIRRCMEKRPEERFQSATDLGYALDALSQVSGTAPAIAKAGMGDSRRLLTIALMIIACLVVAGVTFVVTRRTLSPPPSDAGGNLFTFQRMTFRRGNVLHARFAPDGKTVIYGASLEGNPTEIFAVNPGSPESKPLGFKNADIASISRSGELAIILRTGPMRATAGTGTLARVPLNGGGAPRQLLENVQGADWTPDGNDLVVSQRVGSGWQIQFLSGKIIARSEHQMHSPRISPDGKTVVFFENNGSTADLRFWDADSGKLTTAPPGKYGDVTWALDSRHLYCTMTSQSGGAVLLIDRTGKGNPVFTSTAGLSIHDVAPNGALLLEQELIDYGIQFEGADGQQRNLSWLDGSQVEAISEDGNFILFTEQAEAGGPKGAIYIRKTDGSPAIRLGDGIGSSLSPDGKWVSGLTHGTPSQLFVLPTGPGTSHTLTPPDMNVFGSLWNADSIHIGIVAAKGSGGAKPYMVDSTNGSIAEVQAGKIDELQYASPDFKTQVGKTNSQFIMSNVTTGETKPLPGIPGDANIIQFSSDLKSLYYVRHQEFPPSIYRYDMSGSKGVVWKTLNITDPSVIRIDNVEVTPDGRSFAYTFVRVLSSDLFLATASKK